MEGSMDLIDSKAYHLVRRDNRHLYLKIREGRLEIVAPLRMPQEEIEAVLEKRKDWIDKHLSTVQAPWRYLGEPIEVRVDPEISKRSFEDGILRASSRKEVESWYRDKAQELLFPLTRRWAERMCLPSPKLTVRKMKRRHGTCYPRRPQINYNLWLVMQAPRKIEEVVVHELLHLEYPDHGRSFRKALSDQLKEPSLWLYDRKV